LLWIGCDGANAVSMGFKLGRAVMLMVLAFILLVAWLLGIVGTYTVGAFVHVLLVMAVVLFLVGIISGRRTVV
jgi:hypothetical protein